MREYLKRFRNTGTTISIVGLVGLLLVQFEIKIDLNWLDTTTKLVCSLLVVLGICNNPTTIGLDLPKKDVE